MEETRRRNIRFLFTSTLICCELKDAHNMTWLNGIFRTIIYHGKHAPAQTAMHATQSVYVILIIIIIIIITYSPLDEINALNTCT